MTIQGRCLCDIFIASNLLKIIRSVVVQRVLRLFSHDIPTPHLLYILQPGRRLLIHRTFNEGGQQYSRTEVVKNQAVIDSYLRIVTRDKNYRYVL